MKSFPTLNSSGAAAAADREWQADSDIMLDWGLPGQKMQHLVFTQPSICQGCEPHVILASVLMQISMEENGNPTDGNAVQILITMGGSSQESMCVNES